MSVYTVHEPSRRREGALPEAEGIIFVREGFYFWAFFATPWWMLWHRMWLVLAGYVAVTIAVLSALAALGASQAGLVVAGLLISVLVGLEASTLRRFTLRRRGWSNVGIVSGDDREDAERRFFTAWLRQAPTWHRTRAAAPPPLPGVAPTAPRAPQTSDIVGLFPEPGARR